MMELSPQGGLRGLDIGTCKEIENWVCCELLTTLLHTVRYPPSEPVTLQWTMLYRYNLE